VVREPEAHHRHVELVGVTALVILRAQRQDPIQRQILEPRELLDDELAWEPVDAGRNRSMRGEDRTGAGQLQRGIEVRACVKVLADPFQTQESCMPLVGVEHLGVRAAGDTAIRADGTYAAHAK